MDEDDDDAEDLDLLNAAANWAESGESFRRPRSHPPKYSLHVTQLSYEATDFDIRDFFSTKGCLVTSIRLVRDKDSNGNAFTGVAFVDVRDEKSFELALKCHRSTHLGRRINVRRALPKEELGRIAEATREKVSEIIQASTTTTKSPTTVKPKATSKSKRVSKTNDKDAAKKQSVHKHKRKGRGKPNETGEDRKLTKKERNRKAAILLSKKSRK